MYKLLEISPTAKCSPGISTVPGINSHGRVNYRPQVGYRKNNQKGSMCHKTQAIMDEVNEICGSCHSVLHGNGPGRIFANSVGLR